VKATPYLVSAARDVAAIAETLADVLDLQLGLGLDVPDELRRAIDATIAIGDPSDPLDQLVLDDVARAIAWRALRPAEGRPAPERRDAAA